MHAEYAEAAEFCREFTGRDLPGLKPFRDTRLDRSVHVRAHGIADRAVLIVDEAIDGEEFKG
jgi:hypothetical protein